MLVAGVVILAVFCGVFRVSIGFGKQQTSVRAETGKTFGRVLLLEACGCDAQIPSIRIGRG